MSKLQKIKGKLSIHSTKRSVLLLEGEYVSSLKGKSLDFDDLREYVYGDDVRDIDWRASAKQQVPLVKRYVANRRHNVLFVVNTSVTMLASAPNLEPKHELAADVVGLLGYIAVKHNDNVSLTTETNGQINKVPFMSGEKHVNRLLNLVEASTQENTGMVNIEQLLRKADLSVNGRTIMVVVTDEVAPSEELRKLIRKIQHRHDLIWVTVSDVNPVAVPKTYDVLDVLEIINIPDGLRADLELVEKIQNDEMQRKQELNTFLKGLRVSHTSISSTSEIIPSLVTMLKRREREQYR